jgi:photosystem II stability/assembly factor-like uncharacterized protein
MYLKNCLIILLLTASNIYSQWSFVDYFNFNLYQGFISVNFWDSNTGLIVGRDGKLLKTTDGGLNWKNIESHTILDLQDIEFISKDTIIIVAGESWSHSTNYGNVLFSFDGGNTWINKYESSNELKSVSSTPSGEIYVCGSKGILSTKDLGNNWSNGPSGYFEEIYCVENNYVIAISGPIIMRKNISDGSWDELTYPVLDSRYFDIADIEFVNENTGWIADGLNIYKSSDYGYTWDLIKELGVQITSLSFVDDSLGFACGYSFSIYKTYDGGYTWEKFDMLDTHNALFSIQMFDDLNGVCIGMNVILRTENGGGLATSTKTDQIFSNKYSLSQNYPNPFNPRTNIHYSIEQSDNVKVIVYDLLGNEVEILVDKYQVKGTYSVDFDASYLPSGVYFYNLKCGDYTKTKKLILLK